jgi:hypothetical protein
MLAAVKTPLIFGGTLEVLSIDRWSPTQPRFGALPSAPSILKPGLDFAA